jgi:hypothetical protein
MPFCCPLPLQSFSFDLPRAASSKANGLPSPINDPPFNAILNNGPNFWPNPPLAFPSPMTPHFWPNPPLAFPSPMTPHLWPIPHFAGHQKSRGILPSLSLFFRRNSMDSRLALPSIPFPSFHLFFIYSPILFHLCPIFPLFPPIQWSSSSLPPTFCQLCIGLPTFALVITHCRLAAGLVFFALGRRGSVATQANCVIVEMNGIPPPPLCLIEVLFFPGPFPSMAISIPFQLAIGRALLFLP